MKVFYNQDCDPSIIGSKKVAVIDYGSQGHAHALNLLDSGVEVVVGLREDSSSRAKAIDAGLEVATIAGAVKGADIVMVLIPDERQSKIYYQEIEPNIKQNAALAFAHGFSIHYKYIVPREDLATIMVAPKAPGHTVRSSYVSSGGVPMLVAVDNSLCNSTWAIDLALSYACAIGGGEAGIIETTFRDEVETDLFGEQAVLCGGIIQLIQYGFEVLVESGYSPEMAYFECLHEVKLIVDLVFQSGISGMYYSVSNNAEYGGHTSGSTIVDPSVKDRMHLILKEIQNGNYSSGFMHDADQGSPKLLAMREALKEHPIEEIGRVLRSMMPNVIGRPLIRS